jgi:hypothetical protein
MMLTSFRLPLAAFLLISTVSAGCRAQSAEPVNVSAAPLRVVGDWRTSVAVVLPGSKPPRNSFAVDRGTASASLKLGRMLLLLAPSAAQRQALVTELAGQQNAASPAYHQWLTPAAFAESYGVSSTDAAAVSAWLTSAGFAVAPLPAGRGWIEFSGTVAQVEQAFGAKVRLVSISGTTRAVLVGNISIPTALAPVVAGLVSLDGSLTEPALTTPQPLTIETSALAALATPEHAPALTPQLVARLVDLTPLTKSGLTGAGETIAIASRSNVNSADVAAFRSAFGLAASPLAVAVDGDDPGLTDGQAEATLVASWAGAAAPGAQILLAPAASTLATDGVDLSLVAIVDQDLAQVAAVGYSGCEAGLSAAHQQFYAALYRQAAAEGITVVAAAGDGGAAACTPAGGTAGVGTGYGVNALASTEWNVAVGVAGYGANGAAAGNSALEAWSPASAADPAYAGGGGASKLNARPAWQPASTSNHAAAVSSRALPDLALPAALDTNANAGLAFCLSNPATVSGCTLVRAGGSGAATALFSGIAAILDQKYGDQKYGALGNIAPNLYLTNQSAASAFNDVAQGSAQLPCAEGSAGCGATGAIGYTAGTGYDLATGLGVPDAAQLVNHLVTSYATGITPTVTLTASPSASEYNPSAEVTFTIRVVDSTGAGIPSGEVAISNITRGYDALTNDVTLTSSGSVTTGATATFTETMKDLLTYDGNTTYTGTYSLGAFFDSYTSDYNAVVSGALDTVTVEPSPMTLTITSSSYSPAVGSSITITMTAKASLVGSVAPTGNVMLYVNGSAYGTSTLAATSTSGVYTSTFTVTVPSTTTTIYAIYAGDDNYATATSATTTITATKALVTVVLSANKTTAEEGTAVILTATVTPSSSSSTTNPTGTVSFWEGTTELGSATLSAVAGTTYSKATLTTQKLDGGTDSLTAVYAGDTNYAGATSNTLTVTIEGFTLTADASNPATNLNIVKGSSGAETFDITSVGGYSSTVQVICTVANQDDMSCGASPQQVTPTATVTFTITTYATGGPEYARDSRPRFWPRAAGGLALAGVFLLLLPRGRRARVFLGRRFLALLMLLAGLAGSGMGCTSSPTAVANSGTPLGVATLKVTAMDYVDNAVPSQSLYFTVNVTAQ